MPTRGFRRSLGTGKSLSFSLGASPSGHPTVIVIVAGGMKFA